MTESELSIMIVDDARFSTTVISKNLKSGGFANIHVADSSSKALDMQEVNPASIIIADMMPEMDGIELTKRLRQLDEAKNHYTYIIMLTAKDGIDAMKLAFEEGVDDFVNKTVMKQQLLPRVYAAERLVNNQNKLLIQNQTLLEEKRKLEAHNQKLKGLSTMDSLTGLGNKAYSVSKLMDNLRHTESRGGATCFLILRFANKDEFIEKFPQRITQELLVGISRRLKALVRPLDDVARIDNFTFAVVTHQPTIKHCEGDNFKRIKDAINSRSFQTSMGYQDVKMELALSAACTEFGLPKADALIRLGMQALDKSMQSHRIEHLHYSQVEAEKE